MEDKMQLVRMLFSSQVLVGTN